MTTSQEAREAEVTHDGWRGIAAAAACHGIRYRTNTALMQFLCDIAPYYRQSAERGEAWRPIETAPKDGTHCLACTGGYGEHWTFNQRPPVVVHYWSNPGEEGFYLSTGLVDGSYNDVPLDLQWWKPLGLEPIAADMIHASNPGAAIGAGNRQRVLDWLVTHPGGTNVECGAALGLSVEAVGRHVKAIRERWPLYTLPTPPEAA